MKNIIKEYLGHLERMRGFAKSTLNMHQRLCTTWGKFLTSIRNKELFTAKPEDLLSFIKFRQTIGTVKNVTIAGELCILRTLYGYLYDFQKIQFNPTASLPELICEPPAEKKYLTINECLDLLESINTNNPTGLRDHTIIALLWSTGLRPSELCALDRRDINLREGSLLVRKGKGGKQRQIFFNDTMGEILTRYWVMFPGDNNTPLFHAFAKNQTNKKRHARLSQSSLSGMVRQSSKAVGISKTVSPLTFRHTFATHMYETGVDMKDIKEMLGHDDETETTIYVHISVETARKFIEDHIANPAKYGHGGRQW